MKDKCHLIVIDPTAFSGGSKVATKSILRLLNNKQLHITVLSADKTSWNDPALRFVSLYEPKWLAQKEQGFSYFIRHAFIAINLLITRLRFGRFDVALGASGPGVDLALYLLRSFMNIKIIQLIHGPVAKSRTIARCLKAADQVHYLQSSATSLQSALTHLDNNQRTLPENFHLLKNGLSEDRWPSACQMNSPTVYWAASLLKWKGLDTLLDAIKDITIEKRPPTNICFIRPKAVQLPVSHAPVTLKHVYWHESPNNLDQLRAKSNIFVSTSKNEPFGLSILEAMAAGQCVVIPADGAYWDQRLKNNINCIKYLPGQSDDLKQKLLMLSNNMALVAQLGSQAAQLALSYGAKKQYSNTVDNIAYIVNTINNKNDVNSISGDQYDQL